MPHGGYRRPTNPAAVSGPGAHSKRTDGKQPIVDIPNAAYGEQAAFREIQQGADIPQRTDLPGGGQPQPVDTSGLIGLGRPTLQPDTPVTDGAEYGPGAGPGALGLPNPNDEDREFFQRYLPILLDIAQRDDAAPSVKRAVRLLIARG